MRIESLRDLLSQFPDIDGFWDVDDIPGTENKIREALAVEEANWSPKLVELLTQLARVQGLAGKLSEAGATLLLVGEHISKHDEPGMDRVKIRFLIEQGRFFGLSMNPPQALSYFAKAWDLASKLGEDFFSIEAAVMLSISQPPKSQNDWLQRIIKLAEDTQDPRAKSWLTQLHVMNGWHNFDFRKYDQALASFQKALETSGKDSGQSIQDAVKTQRIKWAVGRTLRALNRLQEGLDIQRSLLEELNSTGKVNGHVYLELGECCQLLKNYDEAKSYFELAYKELSLNGWYSDNRSSELSRIQHLSKKK